MRGVDYLRGLEEEYAERKRWWEELLQTHSYACASATQSGRLSHSRCKGRDLRDTENEDDAEWYDCECKCHAG